MATKKDKNTYPTVAELRKEARRQKFANFSVGDGKDYHTVAELREAAYNQGLIRRPEPTVEQPVQNERRQSLVHNVANKVVRSAADEYGKRRLGYDYLSKYNDSTRYSDVSGDISKLESIKGGAARRGRNTAVYDRAIDMLKSYSNQRYSLDSTDMSAGAIQDRQDLYNDNQREMEKLRNQLDVEKNYAQNSPERQAELISERLGNNRADSDTTKMEQRLDELSAENRKYERFQSAIDKYEGLRDNPDFKETSFDDVVTGSREDKLSLYTKSHDEDFANSYGDALKLSNIVAEGDVNGWGTITKHEKDIYYYLLDNKGEEAAYEYLDAITQALQKRETEYAEEEARYAAEATQKAIPVAALMNSGLDRDVAAGVVENSDVRAGVPIAGLASVPGKMLGGAMAFTDDALHVIKGEETNPYNPAHRLANETAAVMDSDVNYIDDATNGWNIGGFTLGDAYQALASVEEMGLGGMMGSAAYSALMSMDAAQSKAKELYDKGASTEQIVSESLASGAFEYIFEKISLDMITDKIISGMLTKETAPRFIVAALMSAGVEGSEEVFTDAANYVTDIIIMKYKSERQTLINDYLSQGYSQEEAEKLATDAFKQNLFKSFMGGAIAGGLGGSGYYGSAVYEVGKNNVQQKIAENRYAKQTGLAVTAAGNTQELINQAYSLDGDSKAVQDIKAQADKVSSLSAKNATGRKTVKQTGKLYTAMQESNIEKAATAKEAEIKAALSEVYAKKIGADVKDKSVPKVANALYKSGYTSEPLTVREKRIVNNNQKAKEALAEVKSNEDTIQSNIYQAQRRATEDMASTAALTGTKDQTTEKAADIDIDDFNLSDDGKTYTADGEQVDVKTIASVGSDDIRVELPNGKTESVKALDLGSEDQAVIYQGILVVQKGLGEPVSASLANSIVSEYKQAKTADSDLNAVEFIRGVEDAVRKGYINGSSAYDTDSSGAKLSESLQKRFYDEGRQLAQTHTSAQRKAVTERLTGTDTQRKGSVTFEDGVSISRLDERRSVGVKVQKNLTEALGVDTVFYQTHRNSSGQLVSDFVTKNNMSDGKQAPSGFWKDGKLYIDVNAGLNGEGLILFTASHEMTHMMEDGSPEIWQAYADFIVENYVKRGVDVRGLVLKEMSRHTKLNYQQAFREVIARASEGMLVDTHLNEKSKKLYQQNRTLWEKIKDAFSRLSSRIKKAYKDALLQSEEARLVRQWDKETLEKAQEMWLEGVAAAAKNLRNMEGTVNKSRTKKQERYSYDEIVSKANMNITTVDDSITYAPSRETRKAIISKAIDNVKSVGFTDEKGNSYVHVLDIDRDIMVSRRSIEHGLDRRLEISAPVALHVGEILKNSIILNELEPKKSTASGSYVLIGYAESENNKYVVRFTVNTYTDTVDTLDVLYALNTKKEPAGNKPGGHITAPPTGSTISIKDLLDYVNRHFPDVLPMEVLQHYGKTIRPEGALGKSALYQSRDEITLTVEGIREQERQRWEKLEKEIREHYREQRAKNVRKRNTTKLRNSVAKKFRTLDQKLNRTDKDKTIKEGLRPTAAKLLEVGDMLFPESRSLEQMAREGVADATPKEKLLLDNYVKNLDLREKTTTEEGRKNINAALANIRNVLSKEGVLVDVEENGKAVKKMMSVTARERMRYDNAMRENNRLKLTYALTEVEEAYKKVKESPEGYISDSFDQTIIDEISDLKDEVGDTLAKDMTFDQMKSLNTIMTRMLKSITNANKLFTMEKSMVDTAKAVMTDIMQFRKLKDIRNLPVSKAAEFLGWSNFKPIYAMRYIGSDTLTKLYWNVQNGEIVWYKDVAEAKEFKDRLDEKYGVGKLNTKKKTDFNFKKTKTFTALDGSEFTLNLNQMMALYAASRREQARNHLLKGGFTFEKDSRGDKWYEQKVGAKVYQLTAETIDAIVNELAPNEKAYVQEMQEYLSTVMADKGNEVSMQLHGVKLFNEEIYWSITSTDIYAPQNEKEQENQKDLVKKIRNAGFTQKTVKNASNPIVLSGFEESWSSHVNDMSLYHAMTLPLEDFTKVAKYREKSEDDTTGVRGVLNLAYGNAASNYINKLIDDINGGIQEKSRIIGVDKALSRYKKGAVYANMSVVFQQYAALFRSMAYVNINHFAATMPKAKLSVLHLNQAYDELKKYAPVAGIKEMGSFDTGTGRGVVEWLSSGVQKSNYNRAMDWVEDKLGVLPEWMDKLAWVRLWYAVQRETEKNHGFKIGTEENKVKSGERFNEVVHLTQVYDSVLSRSHAMRGKDPYSKMATSFMAEPTTIMNMAVDMVVQAKRSPGQRLAIIAKTSASLILSGFLTMAAHSVIGAMRDDDEDETWGKKYLQSLLRDFIDNIVPTNYFPVLRDLYSMIMGWTVKREDLSPLGDVVAAIRKLTQSYPQNVNAKNITTVITLLSKFTRLPVYNMWRDAQSVVNTYTTATGSWHKLDSAELNRMTPLKYQKAYDSYWEKGYSQEECEKHAKSEVRSYLAQKLKPTYLSALDQNDTEAKKAVQTYMWKSGYYESLSVVDKKLKDWREGKVEEDKRAKTAEERKKNK